jgi:large subunit ribosomal protein L15
MALQDLYPSVGATKERKRIGRGHGSGQGKTAGKGHKGQWARSGGGVRPGFEGGQTSLMRRTPKRGFHNIFGKHYAVVNIADLIERFDDNAEITAKAIIESGLISKPLDGIKILGSIGYQFDCEEDVEVVETESAEIVHEHENCELTEKTLDKKFNVKINIRKIQKPVKSKKHPDAPKETEVPDLLLSASAREKITAAGGSVEVVGA